MARRTDQTVRDSFLKIMTELFEHDDPIFVKFVKSSDKSFNKLKDGGNGVPFIMDILELCNSFWINECDHNNPESLDQKIQINRRCVKILLDSSASILVADDDEAAIMQALSIIVTQLTKYNKMVLTLFWQACVEHGVQSEPFDKAFIEYYDNGIR